MHLHVIYIYNRGGVNIDECIFLHVIYIYNRAGVNIESKKNANESNVGDLTIGTIVTTSFVEENKSVTADDETKLYVLCIFYSLTMVYYDYINVFFIHV